MGTRAIRVGTQRIKVGMQGIRLGMRELGWECWECGKCVESGGNTRIQCRNVGSQGGNAGNKHWNVEIRVGMWGIGVRMQVYKYMTGILQGFS